ncbi:MAG: ABC transporter ATP-binding protein [Xanthomonadales bacterium]|jgi:peptide/nickel transport system ATP-binding protein|nr:ABC transporter ATP-binding protein [Xanthomonadales bacterium]
MSTPVLSVQELSVTLRLGRQMLTVVDGVSFDLRAGEVLALVGESGCGKTKTAEALLGLVPPGLGSVRAKRIDLGGKDLAVLGEPAMRRIRGREISMVFQEPLTALDPVFRAGQQLASVLRRHLRCGRAEARAASLDMLRRVGIADPGRVLDSYPHELSGGMRQRVIIATAMACRPRVLIADEPTTALDVTTQAQVLAQLTALTRESGTAILLITHDLGLVAQYSDRALVMRRGRIVEDTLVGELFRKPGHPYTAELLATAVGLARPAAGRDAAGPLP